MSLRRIQAIFYRYFYDSYRGQHFLADLFFWPFMDILLWGFTTVWIQNHQNIGDLSLILMTALIFWQITRRGAMDISVSLMVEFWNRNLVNLFSSPLNIFEWAVGVISLCCCKLIITISFGSVIVYTLYALNIFSIGWSFIPFTVSLLIFGWVIGFLAASVIIYLGNRAGAFAWMIPFVFAPFSAIFYPVDVLPHWAQSIAWFMPTAYIFEGMRFILSSGGVFPSVYFWTSITLDFGYLGISFVIFKIMFEKSRAKGLARLE